MRWIGHMEWGETGEGKGTEERWVERERDVRGQEESGIVPVRRKCMFCRKRHNYSIRRLVTVPGTTAPSDWTRQAQISRREFGGSVFQ